MINSNYKKSTKGYTSKQIDNQMDEIISELCSKSKLGVFISESGLGIESALKEDEDYIKSVFLS